LGCLSPRPHALHPDPAHDFHWIDRDAGSVAICGHQVSRSFCQLSMFFPGIPRHTCRVWPRFTLTLFRIRNSNRHPANLTNTSMWQRGFSSLPPSFVYSQMLPSLFHRHPNGGCANFLLAHSREAILLPFILSPILCLPTYFVFQVRETYDVDKVNSEAMYHVYFDKDSVLYRWV